MLGVPARSRAHRRHAGPYLVTVLLLCLWACPNVKVQQPSSDSTPPTLVWNVYNFNTGSQADHFGSPTIQAARGERYRVTLKAQDPEGIKQIRLNPGLGSGEMSWACEQGSVVQATNVTFGPMTQDLSPDSSGQVLTSVFLMTQVDLEMPCNSGFEFGGGSAALTGRGTNYFGGVTTEKITFIVSE